MKTEYHADFLESAIACCTAGRRKGLSSMLIARFNLERERVYRVGNADEREDAFQQLHLKWFRDWGLEDVLRQFTSGLVPFASSLISLTYRKARSRQDEGAELYTNAAGERRAVIALRGERFDDDATLEVFLRHEVFHLRDMLDPEFGYEPGLNIPGITQTQQRLATERYRVLWDAAIDARLAREGHALATPREKHAALIDRAFSFWPAERRAEAFARVWSGRGLDHALLAGFARDPRGHDHAGPAPGQPCPLCGMPTFAWAGAESLAPVGRIIRREFATWKPEQGACGRCAEVYGAALALDNSCNAAQSSPWKSGAAGATCSRGLPVLNSDMGQDHEHKQDAAAAALPALQGAVPRHRRGL